MFTNDSWILDQRILRRLMLTFVLLVTVQVGAQPYELTDLRATTVPGTGAYSSISSDGQKLFRARGASVGQVDLAQVRDNELNNPTMGDLDSVTEAIFPLEATIFSVVDDEGDLFVAGGDYGFFKIDSVTGVVTDADTASGGRWCFDVKLTRDKQHIVTVWGGLDRTQIRAYDRNTLALTRKKNVTTGQGVVRAGIGYAIALRGNWAYVAMGKAGLVRVRFRGPPAVVQQGPDMLPPNACAGFTVECLNWYRVRDVAIAGHYLYAAADTRGLVEIDLHDSWGPTMPFWSEQPTGLCPNNDFNYALRVDAVLDLGEGAARNRVVIAVGTDRAPSWGIEWGPYTRYAAPDWDMSGTDFDGTLLPKGDCGAGLFIYERVVSGILDPTIASRKQIGAVRTWESLSLQKADGRFWVYNDELGVWFFRRQTNGILTAVYQVDLDKYSAPGLAYTDPLLSLKDPNLILAGADGAHPPIYRIDTSGPEPELVVVPNTDTSDFRLGVFTDDAQWVVDGTRNEWVVSQRQDGWKVMFFRTANNAPEFFATTWHHWKIPFPQEPGCPVSLITGRTHGGHVVDYRPTSDLIALSRTQIARGIAIYWRSQIEAASGILSGSPLADGSDLTLPGPTPHIDVHPEIVLETSTERDRMWSLRMRMFPLDDGGQERAVLVEAAGSNAEASHADFEHPKLVFVDLTDCQQPGDPCTAQYDPCAQQAISPAKIVVAYGNFAPALAIGVDVATIQSVQYAFMADSAGRVTAFDLTQLFVPGVGAVIADEWQAAPSVLDQNQDFFSDIEIDFEDPGGGGDPVPYAYVAANRAGMLKLQILDPITGGLDLQLEEQLNTPGQALGITIREVENPDGTTRKFLVLGDHSECGLKLYGDR